MKSLTRTTPTSRGSAGGDVRVHDIDDGEEMDHSEVKETAQSQGKDDTPK